VSDLSGSECRFKRLGLRGLYSVCWAACLGGPVKIFGGVVDGVTISVVNVSCFNGVLEVCVVCEKNSDLRRVLYGFLGVLCAFEASPEISGWGAKYSVILNSDSRTEYTHRERYY
jgi:hypothetical protein